ncbi:MAG: MMPL family transporter [Pseudomonadota bacterium]
MSYLSERSSDHPKAVVWMIGVFCAVMVVLVAAPSLAPSVFPYLNGLKVDTDPENMLSETEPVRVYHNEMKAAFALHDLIVVGVANETHESGVFNADTLKNVYALTELAETVRFSSAGGETDAETGGVIAVDIIAPSTVDIIEQAGPGAVSFNWLMAAPPATDDEAVLVREKAARMPMLNETLVSGDGEAIALYIPITSKDVSYRVARALKKKIATFTDGSDYHITGLPVAQDQFGVEMFRQMAISAPAAMVLIFILMWLFFRQWSLIVSPMLVAVAAVIGAMGLLVATGATVHIMSSMIPIFVMPIAVLDAVHILSDFYDRYPQYCDRRKTLTHVMDELWTPMVFTTLTTCAGFASLAFTPIPPVQVFGVFVAFGVFLAWLFTVTLVPAYIMLMPQRSLERFGAGAQRASGAGGGDEGPLGAFLRGVGALAVAQHKAIIVIFLGALVAAGYGVSKIQINDNPVKWFAADHEIRVADRALNEKFAGTYMAYLTLTAAGEDDAGALADEAGRILKDLGTPAAVETAAKIPGALAGVKDKEAFLAALERFADDKLADASDDAAWEAWDDVLLALDRARLQADIFKRPDVLAFVEGLQAHLQATGLVGKSNALPDVVKTVHRELLLGDEAAYRLPETAAGVAQTLITYQNSHRPQDLFKLVTPDYRTANLWIQMKSGDNVDMNTVIEAVDAYMAETAAPVALTHDWFGLTYINVVWQDKMVSGMLSAFLGSFIIVLLLMTLLFRSFAWGLLSLAPLMVTIAVIYGVIGFIGKDYDMPVAVLSALSLGLAVDYAIHFNARSRRLHKKIGDWPDAARAAFGEPARAIFRNVVVIGAGFLPLLLAPLTPYRTVGVFISAILVLAGVTTLLGLPAIITAFDGVFFFRKKRKGKTHA